MNNMLLSNHRKGFAQGDHSWIPRARTILLVLLLIFSLQSLFWFGEHLAVDEQLEQQKHQIDQIRLDVLKITAKVEENGLRLLRHDKWFEDHLETFKLLRAEQNSVKKQGNDGRVDAKGNWVASQQVSEKHIKPDKNLQPVKDDGIKMVVGILSAKRETPTVLKMVQMLVAGLDLKQFKVVVWQSLSSAHDLMTKVELQKMGVLVDGQTQDYDQLKPGAEVPLTLRDSAERVRWRTNHVLDYANLLELCLKISSSQYILILEDDLFPAKQAIEKSYIFAHENLEFIANWAFATLYSGVRRERAIQNITSDLKCGGVSMLYRRTIATVVIEFLRSNPFLAPVDLMVPDLLVKQKHMDVYERTPNLFQHMGVLSTYTGKDQKDRKSESWRSVSFMRDETNLTHQAYPVDQKTMYIGCFADGKETRDLDGLFAPLGDKKYSGTVAKCSVLCQEYYYYGLQFGGECHCGNQFGMFGRATDSHCNMTCVDGYRCGGPLHNSIYKTARIQPKYLGCYGDKLEDRDFDPNAKAALKGKESLKLCSLFCHEKQAQYLALQYGGECYCGDAYGKHGKAEQESDCAMPCRSDSTVICGGKLVNSVYEIMPL